MQIVTPIDRLAALISQKKTSGERPYTLLLGSEFTFSLDKVKEIASSGSRVQMYQFFKGLSRDERYSLLSGIWNSSDIPPHYTHLAGLIRDGYFSVILTTSPGDELESSLLQAGIPLSQLDVIVLGKDADVERRINISGQKIKIIKLRGDLNSRTLDFLMPEESLKVVAPYETVLRQTLDRDAIAAGLSADDYDIERFIRVSEGSLWYVTLGNATVNNYVASMVNVRTGMQVLLDPETSYEVFFHQLAARIHVPSKAGLPDGPLGRPASSNSPARPTSLSHSTRKTRILFLGANPKDSTRLRLDEEIRSIQEAFYGSEASAYFDIEQCWAVRSSDLQTYLLRYRPDIVHFSGHGKETRTIILEDNEGNSHPVPVKALEKLFSILKNEIRCVVLNACYSEKQAKAIAKHVDCVIGTGYTIGDQAAISFARSFYQALGFGKDIKTAYNLGCVQIDMDRLDDQGKPKFISLNGDPTQIVFVNRNK